MGFGGNGLGDRSWQIQPSDRLPPLGCLLLHSNGVRAHHLRKQLRARYGARRVRADADILLRSLRPRCRTRHFGGEQVHRTRGNDGLDYERRGLGSYPPSAPFSFTPRCTFSHTTYLQSVNPHTRYCHSTNSNLQIQL